ncbi:ATP-binding protein [Campylobacter concisus]|uniref:ATP-binding protein n=1 Tax=Campylobacter concisus TaxID=199 RepID=UPI000D37F489|nr:ATP-binding protein [Campylobacter concisus]QPH94506.1 AAA family ATPase [Campylobacter concisus]
MKIQKIHIKYFKAYEDFSIDFNKNNCLIYGENGTGKSSLYEALHSIFYYDNVRNISKIKIEEDYKNRSFKNKDIEICLNLDDGKTISIESDEINNNDFVYFNNSGKKIGDKVIFPNFYFANEKILNRLVKENFYIAIKDTLSFYFKQFCSIADANEDSNYKPYHTESVFHEFKDIEALKRKILNENIKPENETEDLYIRRIIESKIKQQNQYLKIILNKIPRDKINSILKDNFKENISISFDFEGARLDDSDILKFIEPNIKIKINDEDYKGKLYHHFNEAKLKLISVAIYFAIAKQYENSKPGGLKSLVLDDFLSSLDMANRKYIMQYILDEFKDYQKIILTHNLHFFNVIIKLLKLNNVESDWECKKLFIFDDKPEIYDHHTSYISRAEEELKKANLDTAANLLRKEFERICSEFEEALQIGKKEEMKIIIENLKNTSKIPFYNAYKNLIKILENFEDIIGKKCNSLATLQDYIKKQKDSILKFDKCKIKEIKINDFIKNILLNPMSHYDIENECYEKEFKDAIEQLKKLDEKLKIVQGVAKND